MSASTDVDMCNQQRLLLSRCARSPARFACPSLRSDTLNRNDVHALKVAIPSTSDEQAAIASVLSDMDATLAALEAKRNKVCALKQGMMQELLTGKIRLV
jgi:type I restriction enzyme S subunit